MQSRGIKWSRNCLFLCGLMGGVAAVPDLVMADPSVKQSCSSSCSSGTACTFDGVTNVALGGATLSVNDACHLVISNIGSSEQDGFSQVSLTSDSGEVVTEFACPNFSQSLPGDKETVTFYADVPGGIFYTATIENVGNATMEIRPDFSPIGATLYTMTVLNGSTVTRVFSDLPSATFRMRQGDQEEVN